MRIFVPDAVKITGLYQTNQNEIGDWATQSVVGDEPEHFEGDAVAIILKCMDSRTTDSTVNFINQHGLKIAQCFTFSGAEGTMGELISENKDASYSEEIKVGIISLEKHQSNVVAIAGYEDSDRNSRLHSPAQTRRYLEEVQSWNLPQENTLLSFYVYRNRTIENLNSGDI